MPLRAAAAAVFVAAAVAALPSAAQQAPPSGGAGLSFALPQSAVPAGEPVRDPRSAAKAERDPSCAPAWTCRVQLFGTIQKYGGVGLKGTPLTW
jgi:hypothetical protein